MLCGLGSGRFPPGFAFASAGNNLAFRQQFEPQRARYRGCFYQTNINNVTQPVHGTAARADQRMAGLVIVEIFGPQSADRDQAVGAGVAELDE